MKRPHFNWLIPLAALYGIVMVSLSGDLFRHAANSLPYHLLQARALLHGTFSLGNSVNQLHPGLAWYNGQVQQVWGLGIGLWLLPFQTIWSLLGGNLFPDRLALVAAFGLLAFYVGKTGLRLARDNKTIYGIGLVWILLLNPSLWTLAIAAKEVFDETVLYGVLVSLGILTATVRVIAFNSRSDFFICCILAGLTPLVRPTAAIYGLAGMIICGLNQCAGTKKISTLAPTCIFFAGLIATAVTNQIRFGSPTEFGHRLTVSSEEIVYITRFGNPYKDASDAAAAKELAAALFLSPQIGNWDVFSPNAFPGQAPQVRWRRLNFTNFGPSYFIISAFAVVAGVWRLLRNKFTNDKKTIIAMLLWFGASFIPLFIFYLHYPSIMSRYLVDFMPAMTGFILLAWTLLLAQWRRLAVYALAGWLIYGIGTAKVAVSFPTTEQANMPPTPAVSIDSFAGSYAISKHPLQTGIPFNGAGWDVETGVADDVVTLMLDKPQFVELDVSERRTENGEEAKADVYHAMIDGKMLPIKLQQSENDEFKVIFDVPESIRRQNQDQIVFLCFSDSFEQDDRNSERFLYSVSWK